MSDQAQQLRNLKRQATLADARAGMTPPVVALLGSKGGVGTTTLAVCLAEAVSKENNETSAAPSDGRDIPLLQLASYGTRIDDLACLTGMQQLTVAAREPLPWRDGIVLGQLQPGRVCCDDESETAPDIVLADLGCWQGGDESPPVAIDQLERLFLVTTEDTLAMMDTYACVKQLLLGPDSTAVGMQDFAKKVTVVINQILDEQVATAAADRLTLTCRRFLGVELAAPVLIPMSESAGEIGCVRDGSNFADSSNVSDGARALQASLDSLVEGVTAVMEREKQPETCLQL